MTAERRRLTDEELTEIEGCDDAGRRACAWLHKVRGTAYTDGQR